MNAPVCHLWWRIQLILSADQRPCDVFTGCCSCSRPASGMCVSGIHRSRHAGKVARSRCKVPLIRGAAHLVPRKNGILAVGPLGQDLVIVWRHAAALQLICNVLHRQCCSQPQHKWGWSVLLPPGCQEHPVDSGLGLGNLNSGVQIRHSAATKQRPWQHPCLTALLEDGPLPRWMVCPWQHDVVYSELPRRAALSPAHVTQIVA